MDLESLNRFIAKHPFSMEAEGFEIRIAKELDDLKLALKLRHQVFLEEGLNRTHETGYEFDSFDQRADHLMIIDKEKSMAVGTYRLIHSDFSDRFYSQGEFILDRFLNLEGSKLEMGRACTHKDYRTGRTMDLLWQGLSRYIRETNTRYLFGCSSVDSTDPEFVFGIVKSLNDKQSVDFELEIEPTEPYRFPNADDHFKNAKVDRSVLRTLPPLLRSYLHAGSKIYGYPALDEDFACADLLTILDLTKLNSKFNERYKPLG